MPTVGRVMATVDHDRSWPLHPLSLGFSFVLISSLCLVNIYPRVHWGEVNYYLIDDEFAHGWPLVYMQRDFYRADGDMGGMVHGVWPFQRNPGPIRQFRFDYLFFDILAAVLLIGLTIIPIEALLRIRKVRPRYGLVTLLAITGAACIVLAIQRVIPLDLLALHLIPNSVVVLSLVCSCLFVVTGVFRLLVARAAQQ